MCSNVVSGLSWCMDVYTHSQRSITIPVYLTDIMGWRVEDYIRALFNHTVD